MTLIRQLIERVRRWAAPRPLLICTDGLVADIRAIRETFRPPLPTGTGGRPRLRRWRHVFIAQVVKRYAQRRVVAVERRIVDGTPARVETRRRRSQGDGVSNTAYIERLHATFRERVASLTRRGRALAARGLCSMACISSGQSITSVHRTRVWPKLGGRPPRRWLLASLLIAGVCMHSCPIASRHLVGRHPSNVDVPRMRSSV